MDETFKLTLELTQDEINELGELLYEAEGDNIISQHLRIKDTFYDKLVNAASEAGADLP
jgi:hypothetical protein